MEEYIGKLQSAADRLTSENRRLRKCHGVFIEKVRCVYLALMWSKDIYLFILDGAIDEYGSSASAAAMEEYFDGYPSHDSHLNPRGIQPQQHASMEIALGPPTI